MMKKIACIVFIVLYGYIFSCHTHAQVVFINEILVSPPPTNPNDPNSRTNANSMYSNHSQQDNKEWVELYNPNLCDSVDISCYTIGGNMNDSELGTYYSNWGTFTFPPGTKIPPGGLMVLGGNHAMVPRLDYNITDYYNNSYGTQYLDGTAERWFLRNDYGWLAIFAPDGTVIDAVYWSKYGASSLYTLEVFQNTMPTRATCNGFHVFPSAKNIPGIEFVGSPIEDTYTSFQRQQDGGNIWYATPRFPTPNSLNGEEVLPPFLSFTSTPSFCNQQNGTATVNVVHGSTGPFIYQWNTTPPQSGATATGLGAGTYSVTVSDLYTCLQSEGSVTINSVPIQEIHIDTVIQENCFDKNGGAKISVTGGRPPYTIRWNSNPPQYGYTLSNVIAGNYTVYVTDSLGCEVSLQVLIERYSPDLQIYSASDTCSKGVGYIVLRINGGVPPYEILWENPPGDTNRILSGLHSGIYIVHVSDQICTLTDTVMIFNTHGPEMDFTATPNPLYINSGWCTFECTYQDAVNWYWDFGDESYDNTRNPSHRYEKLGSYTVTLIAYDSHGCVDTVRHVVVVKDLTSIYFPNAFSPNNDNFNDVFLPQGINVTGYHLQIYNRWGEMIFETKDFYKGWDGKDAPSGIYVWRVSYLKDVGDNRYEYTEEKGRIYLHRD